MMKAFLALITLVGCSTAPSTSDAGVDPTDAGRADGPSFDGGVRDAFVADGGVRDALVADAFVADASESDASERDGGIDVGEPDAGPGTCSIEAPDTCAVGSRCTWVNLDAESGETRCVPTGEVPLGSECVVPEPGPDAVDSCEEGVCQRGTCALLCEVGADSCASTESCVAATRFESVNGGVCIQRCNPLTGVQADGSMCPAGTGCYETSNNFRCLSAGNIEPGEAINPGDLFDNACVPGSYTGRGLDEPECSAAFCPTCLPYCLASESHIGNTTNQDGRSPFGCSEQGLVGDFECRFHPSDGLPGLPSGLGVCVTPSGTGTPSCADLPATDTNGDGVEEHRANGCAPAIP